MFSNAYQNGPIVEIWDARVDPNKHPLYRQLAKINSSSPRAFDKDIKSYIHSLQGLNGKMTLPADDSKTLALHQQYLVLQIQVPSGVHWWIELGFTDLKGTRRRVNLTTVQGKQEMKYFSYRYPLEVSRGTWLFLGIDLYSFMEAFKGQTFRALDHCVIGSSCRLRRIFTMKQFVEYQIPKGFWLSQELPQSLELVRFEGGQSIRNFPDREDVQKSDGVVKKAENRSQLVVSNRKPGRVTRSPEAIIGEAKKRLKSLQKEEQLLLNLSQRLGDSPLQTKQVKSIKKDIRQSRPLFAQSDSPKVVKRKKEKQNQKKLPHLERSFQEDEALRGQGPTGHVEPKEKRFLESKEGVFPSTVLYGGEVRGERNPRQLELIYDEMVGCYYHPETNSYFQLKP